ncbi:hypothetical protein AS589_03235 [Empedobacter brevis]|uniref:hypothetical protein n=1 Tax=Empedobacter brevis TaxID=247 RepID=UPI00131FE0D2|nr:hypothetical protein [Empedobacter brevis]QHC83873.1 hypothetical protein AS589_03235 [Empedobacter brevis]
MKKIFLPKSVDVEKIILTSNNQYINISTGKYENYIFDLNSLKIESIYYILFIIFRKTIQKLNVLGDHDKLKYMSNGKFISNDIYIDLPSKTLEGIDRNYNKIMKFLASKHEFYDNILFRSNYNNGKSFSYCLNYNLINSEFKIMDITKSLIIKRMNESCITSINGSIISRKLLSLKNDFENKFNIDFNELRLSLSENIIKGYSSLFNLFDYENGKKWMSLNDEKDGRLHTNFTNLNSEYRKLVRTKKGDNLVEIDISSCIPYLLTMSIIFSEELNIDFNVDLKKYLNLFTIIKKRFIENKCEDKLAEELKLFLHAFINDNFYSMVNNNSNFTKKDILSFYFCKNGEKPEIENHIIKLFPNFYYLLFCLKDNQTWIDYYGYPPKYNCNELLSHFLFHLEAKIMLFDVCKEIKKSNKKIEIITIHDCVLVSSKYATDVRSIIENIFINLFELPPSIKIKY